MTTRLLGISGSLRADSWNTSLLRAAQGLVPQGVEFAVATLHGIPLYDGDVEQRDGIPPAVQALGKQIAASDGVLLATPEYNNGIPGVFKNAIDWLSRPAAEAKRAFRDRPFAVIGASPGGFGTVLAQGAWLPVLRSLGVRHWHGDRLMVSRASNVFDPEGKLTDDAIAKQLAQFIAGFAAFAAERAAR